MRTILVSLLFSLILGPLLLVGRPTVAHAAAADSCLPAERDPVAVLVRGGAGLPLAPMDTGDADPFIDVRAGRTVVPMRPLFEALSPGVDSVRWYDDLRMATFWFQGHTLSIRFGRDADRTYSASVDGKLVGMTSYLCEGRVWVPVRAVAEALKLQVDYADGPLVTVDALAAPVVAGPKLVQTAATCPPLPKSVVDGILSPRQAAQATGCLIKKYQA